MEQLAQEFVANLALPDTAGQKTTVESGLRVEVVSAKGLTLPLETRELAQGLQVSVLYRQKHYRSQSILCSSTDPVLNFSADFSVTRHELLTEDKLVMLYISIAPSNSSDQVSLTSVSILI